MYFIRYCKYYLCYGTFSFYFIIFHLECFSQYFVFRRICSVMIQQYNKIVIKSVVIANHFFFVWDVKTIFNANVDVDGVKNNRKKNFFKVVLIVLWLWCFPDLRGYRLFSLNNVMPLRTQKELKILKSENRHNLNLST